MNIETGHFKELAKKGISLDLVFLLTLSKSGQDITCFEEPKIKALITTLRRKGLLDDNIISNNGLELLKSLDNPVEEIKLGVATRREDEWEKFLKNYPPNNSFIWQGKKFEGDRGIRKNSKDGKALFTNILNENEYTCDDLIGAVVIECINKMKNSVSTGVNKMNYFVNTETYLRQKLYINWVEEGRGLNAVDLKKYLDAYNRSTKKSNSKVVDI